MTLFLSIWRREFLYKQETFLLLDSHICVLILNLMISFIEATIKYSCGLYWINEVIFEREGRKTLRISYVLSEDHIFITPSSEQVENLLLVNVITFIIFELWALLFKWAHIAELFVIVHMRIDLSYEHVTIWFSFNSAIEETVSRWSVIVIVGFSIARSIIWTLWSLKLAAIELFFNRHREMTSPVVLYERRSFNDCKEYFLLLRIEKFLK